MLRSAGIRSVGPLPPPEETISAAKALLDLDISDHRAAGLRLGELKESDLVIGFEQRHIATAVVEGGARRERSFLLSELITLLPLLQDERPGVGDNLKDRIGKLLELAHRARSARPERDLEIHDPMGQGPDKHAKVAGRVAREVISLARNLFPPPPPPPNQP